MNAVSLSIRPAIFDRFPSIVSGLSTRNGGVSEVFGMNTSFHIGDTAANVEENRKRFFKTLGISPDNLVSARQCHSTNIAVVRKGGIADNTDALITDVPGVWLSVSVADCVPVLIADPGKRVVAAVHAGWRGSAGHIVEKTVSLLHRKFECDAKDLFAYIGPSAGSCCYEVGKEVAEQFSSRVVTERRGRVFLDLKHENLNQLHDSGLKGSSIEVTADCTICRDDIYHSYRRDKDRSGRMMGVIGMVNDKL